MRDVSRNAPGIRAKASKKYVISIPGPFVLPESVVEVFHGRIVETDPPLVWAKGKWAFLVFMYVRQNLGTVRRIGDPS